MRFVGNPRLRQWGVICGLISLLVGSVVLRSAFVAANLPVCVNVDERTTLRVLHRMHTVSLNPEFFHYPTLFYYLVHFVAHFLPLEKTLVVGRLVNVLVSCGLGVGVFWMSRKVFADSLVGLVGAALTLFSPIVLMNGSYPIVDPLMTLFIIVSLTCFWVFFREKRVDYWWWGVVFAGLAISTKYTAMMVVLTYAVWEIVENFRSAKKNRQTTNQNVWIAARFSPAWLSAGMLSVGCGAVLFGIVVNEEVLQRFVSFSGGINASLDTADLLFVKGLVRKVYVFGGALITTGALIWWRPRFFERFCMIRFVVAIGVVGIVFFAGSPAILFSFKTFLYDFGAEMKANAFSTMGPQWVATFERYLSWESILVGVLAVIGGTWSVVNRVGVGIYFTYLAIAYILTGSATRGFPRYLTPVLPFIHMFAAYGFVTLIRLALKRQKALGIFLCVSLCACVVCELVPLNTRLVERSRQRDEMYRSFFLVLERSPEKLLFSGYAPDVELRIARPEMEILEVPKIWFKGDAQELTREMEGSTVLLMDRRAVESAGAFFRRYVVEVYGDEDGYGQHLFVLR